MTISVRLTVKLFDATQREAEDARMTMAEWIRHTLDRGNIVDKNRP